MGQAVAAQGALSCAICESGRYSDASGSVTCAECDAGRYASEAGRTSCKDCPAGLYEPNAWQETCTGICSCGYFCDSGATSSTADLCREGFYCPAGTTERQAIGDKQGGPVGGNSALFCSTQDCPSGAQCANGVASGGNQVTGTVALPIVSCQSYAANGKERLFGEESCRNVMGHNSGGEWRICAENEVFL